MSVHLIDAQQQEGMTYYVRRSDTLDILTPPIVRADAAIALAAELAERVTYDVDVVSGAYV